MSPTRPLGPCVIPGCPGRATNHGRCAEHATVYERQRGSAASRGYGADWRRLRAEFLAEHPFCVKCGEPATDVDHVVPREQGGSDEWENLQAMCAKHHSRKTAMEDGGFGNVRH